MVIELDKGKLYVIDHAPALDKTFCDTNADARSVCGS